MRIRSIKPEFWRSHDITGLGWNSRLLFIGLWSYVEDNGVGIDDLPSVVGDLFAADLVADPRETLARVTEGLGELSKTGLITRYEAEGRRYLHITGWSKHQRIDHPNKARLPLPTCGNADPPPEQNGHSRNPRESLAPGAVEQGNRGTGESTGRAAPADATPTTRSTLAVVPPPEHATTQTIIGEYITSQPNRPPKRVIGQLSKEIRSMLDEGINPIDVHNGVTLWATKDLHPSTLASVVNESMNGHRKLGTTDRRVLGWAELSEQLKAKGQ